MSDAPPTRSLRRVFRVDRKDIGYLRFTLESYDGMAVVSTIDPQPAFIEVLIAPGCETHVTALLDSLRNEGKKGMTIEDAPVSA